MYLSFSAIQNEIVARGKYAFIKQVKFTKALLFSQLGSKILQNG